MKNSNFLYNYPGADLIEFSHGSYARLFISGCVFYKNSGNLIYLSAPLTGALGITLTDCFIEHPTQKITTGGTILIQQTRLSNSTYEISIFSTYFCYSNLPQPTLTPTCEIIQTENQQTTFSNIGLIFSLILYNFIIKDF